MPIPYMHVKYPILKIYEDRCHQCYMRLEICICKLIPSIDNQTFVSVIMHHRESSKTTNTARLACMSLSNSRIFLRGLKNEPLNLTEINDDKYQSILLTLSDRSQLLTSDLVKSFKKPIQLIVPDGNWRQANRMSKREKYLQNIPWVKLSPGAKSCYRLRHEHNPEGLSTLEAIACALSIIETPKIEEQLMTFFKIMVERTIATRPKVRVESKDCV